jgi:phospholipid/cholesterol/gamma-HCH transport system permease protein
MSGARSHSPALTSDSALKPLLAPFAEALHELGALGLFVREVAATALRTRGNWPAIVEQMSHVCFRSLSTVVFAGTFVGAIIVLQFNAVLLNYDAQIFLGGLNTSAVVREVGPLMITFILAGKIGAYTAAELGTMRVTEQIDAVECLGTDPIQYLVLPRFLAIVLSSLILLALGLLISIGGSTLVATFLCGMNPLQYVSSIQRFVGAWTLICGGIKSLVYGVIVAGVSCHKGYTASGGARGVGTGVTRAALYMSLFIIFANYLTSSVLEWAHTFAGSLFGWVDG